VTGPVTWQRKPSPGQRDGLVTAQFKAWLGPLSRDVLTAVAQMADPDAEVAVAEFSGGQAAVVQWRHSGSPVLKWTVVRAGHHLAYDTHYGSLSEVSDATLASWYDRQEQP
jgi:hypothetical protein